MAFRDNYKTRLCHLYARGSCERVSCTFAHGEDDLRKPAFGGGGRSFGHRRQTQSPPPEYLDRRRRYSPPSTRKRGRSRSPDRTYDDYSDRSDESRSPSPSYSSDEKYRDSKRDRRIEEDKGESLPSALWNELEDEKRVILKDISAKREHLETLQTLLDRKKDLSEDLSARAALLEEEIAEKEAAVNKVSSNLKKLLKAQQRVVSSQDDVKRMQSKLQKLVAEISPEDSGLFSVVLPPEQKPALVHISKEASMRSAGLDINEASGASPAATPIAQSKATGPGHGSRDLRSASDMVLQASSNSRDRDDVPQLPSGGHKVQVESPRRGRSSGSRRDGSTFMKAVPDAEDEHPPRRRFSKNHDSGRGRGPYQVSDCEEEKDQVAEMMEYEGHSERLAAGAKRGSFERPDHKPHPASLSKGQPPHGDSEGPPQNTRPGWTEATNARTLRRTVDQDEDEVGDDGADEKEDAPRVSLRFGRDGVAVKRGSRDGDSGVDAVGSAATNERQSRQSSLPREMQEDGELDDGSKKRAAPATSLSRVEQKSRQEKKPLFPIRDTGRLPPGRGQPSLLQKHQLQVQEQLKQTQAVRQQVEKEKMEQMKALMSAGDGEPGGGKPETVEKEAEGKPQNTDSGKTEGQKDEEAPAKLAGRDVSIKIGHGKLVQPHQVLKGQPKQGSTADSQAKAAEVPPSGGLPESKPLDPKHLEYTYHFKPEDRVEASSMAQQYPPSDASYAASASTYIAGYSMETNTSQRPYSGYGVEYMQQDSLYMQPDNPPIDAGAFYGGMAENVAAAPEVPVEDSEPTPPGMDNDEDGPPGVERSSDSLPPGSLDLFSGAEVECGEALHYNSDFYDSCCREAALEERPEFPHPLSAEV